MICKRQEYHYFMEVEMHYRTQETTLIHSITQYFCKIKFNTNHPFKSRSQK